MANCEKLTHAEGPQQTIKLYDFSIRSLQHGDFLIGHMSDIWIEKETTFSSQQMTNVYTVKPLWFDTQWDKKILLELTT